MMKVAILIWVILGTVLAGIAVMIVLSVPSLSDQGIKVMPYAGIGGFVVAIPFALLIGSKIFRSTARS